MEWLDTHVSSVDPALQQRPEVFKAVGVDASVDVFDSVIHNLVRVGSSQSLIRKQRIGVEGRARFDVLLDLRSQGSFLPTRYDDGANFAP